MAISFSKSIHNRSLEKFNMVNCNVVAMLMNMAMKLQMQLILEVWLVV